MEQLLSQRTASRPVSGLPAIFVDAAPPHTRELSPMLEGAGAMVLDRWHLGRLVMLAAETGARFEREDIAYDPAAWMAAPRRLFGGRCAIEACREELPFLRGMLLHGLGCGLDADPDEMDDLIVEPSGGNRHEPVSPAVAGEPRPGPELYTATVVSERGGCTTRIFYAAMAEDADALLARLAVRIGSSLMLCAEVRRGFDASHPVVRQSVSAAACALLVEVAASPTSPLAEGLDVLIEHRSRS
jgi:hypothetical protein